MNATAAIARTTIHRIEADGVIVFYREAGPADASVLLLLLGFSTSSFQFRELMPGLAGLYRVIAPDLPGFDRPLEESHGDDACGAGPSPQWTVANR